MSQINQRRYPPIPIDTIPDLDLDEVSFFIYVYKTIPCTDSRPHDSDYCTGYHHEKERRRKPQNFHYLSYPCLLICEGSARSSLNIRKAWRSPTVCVRGDKCRYAHTIQELWYHPDSYKTKLCSRFVEDCKFGVHCKHAHSNSERRHKGKKSAERRAFKTAHPPVPVRNVVWTSVHQETQKVESRNGIESKEDSSPKAEAKSKNAKKDEDEKKNLKKEKQRILRDKNVPPEDTEDKEDADLPNLERLDEPGSSIQDSVDDTRRDQAKRNDSRDERRRRRSEQRHQRRNHERHNENSVRGHQFDRSDSRHQDQSQGRKSERQRVRDGGQGDVWEDHREFNRDERPNAADMHEQGSSSRSREHGEPEERKSMFRKRLWRSYGNGMKFDCFMALFASDSAMKTWCLRGIIQSESKREGIAVDIVERQVVSALGQFAPPRTYPESAYNYQAPHPAAHYFHLHEHTSTSQNSNDPDHYTRYSEAVNYQSQGSYESSNVLQDSPHDYRSSIHVPGGSSHVPRGSLNVPRSSSPKYHDSSHIHPDFSHAPQDSPHAPQDSPHAPRYSSHVPQGFSNLPQSSPYAHRGSSYVPHGYVHQSQDLPSHTQRSSHEMQNPDAGQNLHLPSGLIIEVLSDKSQSQPGSQQLEPGQTQSDVDLNVSFSDLQIDSDGLYP